MLRSSNLESRMLFSGSTRTYVAKDPTATRKGAQFHIRYCAPLSIYILNLNIEKGRSREPVQSLIISLSDSTLSSAKELKPVYTKGRRSPIVFKPLRSSPDLFGSNVHFFPKWLLSRLPEFPPSTGTTWGQWSQLSCCKRCWMEKGGTPTEIRHFCCSVSSLGHVGDYLSRWTSPCSVIIVWNGILPDVSNHLHEGLLPRVHFQHLECFNLLQLVNWFPTLIPLRISLTRFTLVSFCSICLVWYLSIMYHTLAESSFFQFDYQS